MWCEKLTQRALLELCWLQVCLLAPAFAQEVFYKIPLDTDGIYQLEANAVRAAGIDLTGIDPRAIRMFNNGGRELPQDLHAQRPDGLLEIAIYVAGEEDGRFDPEDYILFYGRSVHGFEFDEQRKTFKYHLHHYTNTNVYWLAFGSGTPGKRMRVVEGRPAHPNAFRPTSFRQFIHLEEERLNPLRAGLSWDWEAIASGQTKEFTISLDHLDASGQVSARLSIHGPVNFTGSGTFEVLINHEFAGQFTYSGSRQSVFNIATSGLFQEGANVLTLHAVDNFFFLDWLEIEAGYEFKASQNSIDFPADAASGWHEYTLEGFDSADLHIFEISRRQALIKPLGMAAMMPDGQLPAGYISSV